MRKVGLRPRILPQNIDATRLAARFFCDPSFSITAVASKSGLIGFAREFASSLASNLTAGLWPTMSLMMVRARPRDVLRMFSRACHDGEVDGTLTLYRLVWLTKLPTSSYLCLCTDYIRAQT